MSKLLHLLTSRRIGRAFLILLVPGIALKRWLALGALGALCIALGIVFALKISLWPGFTSLAELISLRGEPSIVRAAVFIGAGIAIAVASSIYLTRSLTTLRVRRRHWRLLDSLPRESMNEGNGIPFGIEGGEIIDEAVWIENGWRGKGI